MKLIDIFNCQFGGLSYNLTCAGSQIVFKDCLKPNFMSINVELANGTLFEGQDESES